LKNTTTDLAVKVFLFILFALLAVANKAQKMLSHHSGAFCQQLKLFPYVSEQKKTFFHKKIK
jgi:hypothetical protein